MATFREIAAHSACYVLFIHTPVPQTKTGNVLKRETMANLFMGKEYPVLI